MTTEAIPKFLFVDESTEELHDKRIKKFITYEDDESGQTVKKENFHFINQLHLPSPVSNKLK